MRMVRSERVRTILAAAVILGVLYLFYHSLWAAPLAVPGILIYRKMRKKELETQRADRLRVQFRDMLESLAASLRVGYSVENALKECRQEMELIYGEGSVICEELGLMLNQFRLGMTAEEVFREFARRNRVEDIDTFSSVFSIAKRTGGDMVSIIRRTSDNIAGRLDTRIEIAVLVSSRKLEHHIMTLIPAGMILYINLTSNGLLDPLYGNPLGILIMTVCLGICVAALLMGKKIIQISA